MLLYHLVPSESASLVGKQVLDPPKLLGNGATPYQRAGNGAVTLDDPGVHQLTHVQVDTETAGPEYACDDVVESCTQVHSFLLRVDAAERVVE